MVVAMVDVVGLKTPDNTARHNAGDELLERRVAAIGKHLRAYGLIVRSGPTTSYAR